MDGQLPDCHDVSGPLGINLLRASGMTMQYPIPLSVRRQ